MKKRLDDNEVSYEGHLNAMESTMNALLKETQQVRRRKKEEGGGGGWRWRMEEDEGG